MTFLSRARRNALNDDVSRLLDPQYSPSNKYPSLVKDIHGDFHDPDYRPFTPISPPRSHSPRRVSSPRPYWETLSITDDDHTNDDDDDDDACDERRLSDGYAYSSRYAHRSSSGHYRRDNRYSYSYAHPYPSSYTPSYASYSYSPSTLAESSSPTSWDSEATVLSEESFNEKEKHGWSGVLKRKRKDKGKERELDETREDDEHVEPIPEATSSPTPEFAPEPQLDVVAHKEEYVPTCGDVFQRHWQTFCLAFNLSVFRAQRRMKHRVHSLLSTH
ncbi:hypothetical protein P691DRAFT_776145 [Macrolepiota fuliginosa MF-IS2]|uniref:Uncharacterized protein n=1 Tax=Macrolepiota fuliginosa MF-IS2 TaxID=1400762 RepID=A0A9P5XD89_9AGAR|nr:hypothetical protein P691DRAFT_776145 [Macrolepiota fuliginosa MF-IS2]